LTSKGNYDSVKTIEVTEAQFRFLLFCKQFGWGKLEVDVKDGQPVGCHVVVRDGVVQQYNKFD